MIHERKTGDFFQQEAGHHVIAFIRPVDQVEHAPEADFAAASHDAKIVALGDKLSNMRAISRDYAVMGDALWNIFHAKDPKDHEWHYRGLAKSLEELRDTFAYQEFERLINQVFGK